MWGNTRKRKATRTRVVTLIGQQTQILGDIRFSEGLLIEGTVKGNVFAEEDGRSMLSLSESGTIEGEVSVPYVWLNGIVIGDVHSSEHVELSSRARVTGNVYYSLIEMAIGAEVNGKLVHSPQTEGSPLALSHVDPLEVPE